MTRFTALLVMAAACLVGTACTSFSPPADACTLLREDEIEAVLDVTAMMNDRSDDGTICTWRLEHDIEGVEDYLM
ncbi:MAG: hypothetical protein H0V12_05915, partial [Chloroflexi bacterium]|nr:hypothetical protein [Chloroflexota bacterium]